MKFNIEVTEVISYDIAEVEAENLEEAISMLCNQGFSELGVNHVDTSYEVHND